MPNGVVIRWWGDRGRALVFYAWGFAFGLLYLALRTGQFQPIHRVLMGSFAAALAYFAVVRIVNVTKLRVVDERLVVSHGPLPWRSGMSVSLKLVDDVAIDRASWRLQLTTARGEEVALVDDVRRDAAARLDGELTALLARGSEGAAS